MAKQLTIRGVPDQVASRLDKLSKNRGRSLNATVVDILARAVGFDERRERLARYATWTADDVTEFGEALAAQRVVDDHLWQ
jgi:plasmid stability protein